MKIKIPFLSWTEKADLEVPIPDETEERFRLRAAVEISIKGGASLDRANLYGANLYDANLTGAYLHGAIMPDGRTYEQWQADPLAGLCAEPEARNRAIAAWGAHTWQDCPLTMGMGIHGPHEAPAEKRLLVATFVALFDGGQLPRPEVTP